MHIYAWAVIGALGLIFLISGWSPFPLLLGGRNTGNRPGGWFVRVMGLCFVTAAVLPLAAYRHIVSVLWISIVLVLLGFGLLVVGMIRATTGRAI